MQNLLTLENTVSAPIEEGDAGVILKLDGSFKLFSTGDMNGGSLTPAQLEQGKKLNALAVALSLPQIMAVLFSMAEDPNIVGEPGVAMGQAH